ncbi:hypothetical protein [Aeromicrobium sp. Leaf350]|uniref:hypothetical protein n=1 Tax=Aeromicrobium sp. Leaf350 TaxID=2876565 RepID=UPI001E496A83|nr:hypothetical protein [Aeromicrobium sp. Leaf350]
MVGTPRSRTGTALLAALVAVAVAVDGCSSDSDTGTDEPRDTVLVAPGTTCDRELNTDSAATTNEQVGGLRNDDFSVRFSQTTRLGNVALVTGDLQKAFRLLTEEYGVALVAEYEPDDSGLVVGFAQIRALVDEYCAES